MLKSALGFVIKKNCPEKSGSTQVGDVYGICCSPSPTMWPGASSSGPLGLGCVKFHHERYERVRKKNLQHWKLIVGFTTLLFLWFCLFLQSTSSSVGNYSKHGGGLHRTGKMWVFLCWSIGETKTHQQTMFDLWFGFPIDPIATFPDFAERIIRWFTPSSFPIFCGFSSTLFCWLNSHFWWWKSTRFIVHGKYA